MILDAGLLIALDRGERPAHEFVLAAERAGADLHTSHPVVAQVWRDPRQQWELGRFLGSMTIHAFSDGRAVGRLMAVAGTSDPIDAHLVQLGAVLGEAVLTADVDDFGRLAEALGERGPSIKAWP